MDYVSTFTTPLKEAATTSHFFIKVAYYNILRIILIGGSSLPNTNWIISGYRGNNLTTEQQEFNSSLSRVRQSEELNFGRMKSLWCFVTYKMSNKISSSLTLCSWNDKVFN
ncbi:hypothetical protein THRCLA_23255 [Thraustotheca clavata]|uniref:DDE Tnp4 domain-containing protein n=1 Tax=Thraustotheca clavata TaxID=74557 RepID=A0A1V9Y8Q4_9STRA|nr:hypothetical protein THRCLA_23255 [Thraustotheca clavata]